MACSSAEKTNTTGESTQHGYHLYRWKQYPQHCHTIANIDVEESIKCTPTEKGGDGTQRHRPTSPCGQCGFYCHRKGEYARNQRLFCTTLCLWSRNFLFLWPPGIVLRISSISFTVYTQGSCKISSSIVSKLNSVSTNSNAMAKLQGTTINITSKTAERIWNLRSLNSGDKQH